MPRVNVCFLALMADCECPLKPKDCHPERMEVRHLALLGRQASSLSSHFNKQDTCRPRQAGSLSSDVAERAARDGRLHEFPPAKIVAASNVLSRFPNRHFRNCFYHPLEVFLTHGGYFRVWRGIAKIDRHRHAVAHSELYGVQIVAEKFV